MDKVVSVGEAKRDFSKLLRTVQSGGSVVVTKHGKPFARITPLAGYECAVEAARSDLIARLKRQRVVKSGRSMREDLYDKEPLLQLRKQAGIRRLRGKSTWLGDLESIRSDA